jgi:prophage DNA circulation protein
VADDAQAKSGSMADQIKAAAVLRTRLPAESSVLAEAVTVFRRDIATLIRTPSSFSQQVASLMTQIQGVYKNPADAYVAYRSLLRFGNTLPAIAETTRTRKQQAINQKALIALSKRATLIGMARTTAGMTFESYDDAVKVRDELAGFIDNESLALGDTDDDQAYLDLQGLRASVIKDITDRAANLERVKEMIPSASLPALVTSYEIYDTANRDQEIVQRNKVQHPGYLPAGRPLQVLIG